MSKFFFITRLPSAVCRLQGKQQRAQVSVLPVNVEWRDRSPVIGLLDGLFGPAARRTG